MAATHADGAELVHQLHRREDRPLPRNLPRPDAPERHARCTGRGALRHRAPDRPAGDAEPHPLKSSRRARGEAQVLGFPVQNEAGRKKEHHFAWCSFFTS